MQAYYEIETEILDNHQLLLSLPDNIPTGRAKVAIIYELPTIQENKIIQKKKNFAEILNAIPNVGLDSDFERKEDNKNEGV